MSQPASQWYRATYQRLLIHLKDPNESRAITQALLQHYLGYTTIKHLLDTPLTANSSISMQLDRAIERACNLEPVQYILGYVHFCENKFQVNKHVLIPRPETADMVQWLLHNGADDLTHILDLGTGSGCIAITLACAYPKATVEAIDISPKALALAQKNAHALQVHVHWHLLDILKDDLPTGPWDLIISNPPYIPYQERLSLPKHIVHYEPFQALFVPDTDPLVFYKRISFLACNCLTSKGILCVEVYDVFAQAIVLLFKKAGFHQVTTHKDIHSKVRWIVARVRY